MIIFYIQIKLMVYGIFHSKSQERVQLLLTSHHQLTHQLVLRS